MYGVPSERLQASDGVIRGRATILLRTIQVESVLSDDTVRAKRRQPRQREGLASPRDEGNELETIRRRL